VEVFPTIITPRAAVNEKGGAGKDYPDFPG
jgi:hypothetical protein